MTTKAAQNSCILIVQFITILVRLAIQYSLTQNTKMALKLDGTEFLLSLLKFYAHGMTSVQRLYCVVFD